MIPSTLRARAGRLLLALAAFVPAALALAAPPPVLDRELFFGNPEIAGASCRRTGSTSPF